MCKALFIINPVLSHYMASFPLAKAIQNQGFKVFFAGSEGFRGIVETEGFKFIPFEVSMQHYLYSFKSFLGFFIKNILSNDSRERYKKFYQNIQEIQDAFSKCHPEIVFIDEHLSSYFFSLKKYNIPIIILNTKLSTKKVFNIPHLSSNHIPKNGLISMLKIEFFWLIHLAKLRRPKRFEKIAFLGKDNEFFLKRYCKKNEIDYKQAINKQNAFYAGLNNIPTIILAPQNLEFSQKKNLPNEFYLNFRMKKDESKHFTKEYNALTTKMQSLKNTKVIYCAFGTLSPIVNQGIMPFVNKLINVITQKEILLIISTGRPLISLPQYANFYLFPFLPQLDILKYCDLMITHGGLGSIKECLQAGVPMLVYPIHPNSDQRGNAARVVANGFGLRGDMKKDSEAEIARKINILLTQPFRKHREVDSEEKVMELLRDLGIEVPIHLLTQ
jgi:UDP:flavonoid glycosyltransferase YjiC (YdhE family)